MRPGLLAAFAAQAVIPVLRVSITSGVAPLGVVVDGVQSENANWRDHLFFFDFGDGAAGTYTYGARPGTSKGKHVGMPVSAYCYENPGNYTIRMWVYDGARVWGPVSQVITVTDPDTVYAGANTICVSTSGDFTDAPAGATQVTTSNWNTVLVSHVASSKRILLRAGEVWTMGSAQSLAAGKADCYFGAFGSGAKPIIRASANYVNALQGLANGSNPANNAKRWRVKGLRFESGGFIGGGGIHSGIIAPAAGPIPLNPSSADGWFTVHDCEFSGVYFPLQLQGRGHVVSKCVAENMNNGTASSGATGWYSADGFQLAVIDSSFDNNHGSEHIIRYQGGKLTVFQGVTMKRPPAGKHFLTLRGATTYTSDYNGANYCVIDGSTTTTAVDYVATIAPQNITSNEAIAKNWLDGCVIVANDRSQIGVNIEAVDVEVRNCVGRIPATGTHTGGWKFVQIQNSNTAGAPDPAGNRVLGNSFEYQPAQAFSLVVNASGSTGLQVRGNVAYAPNAVRNGNNGGSAPSLIEDANGDAVVSGNSSNAQVKSANPLWAGPNATVAGYIPGVGSPYINAGAASAGLINEAQGYLRNSGGYDMGGVNSAAKATDPWTLIPA